MIQLGVALVFGATLASAGEVPTTLGASAVEAQLLAGAVHRYRLPAEVPDDAVVHLTVEQRGVDVAVSWSEAAGGERFRVDSPSGRRGTEALLLEPPWAPDGVIELSSLDARAPTGGYRLAWTVVPTASPTDATRLAALRHRFAAARAYAAGGDTGRRDALAAHRRELPLWRQLGERSAEARALSAVALFERLTGDTVAALASYEQALALWRTLGDEVEMAWVENDLGFTRAQAGDAAGALVAYEQAIARFEALGDVGGLGRALNNRGLLHHNAGDPRAARPFYERALPLLAGAQQPTLAATVLNNLAAVLDTTGEPDAALATYERVIATHRELGNRREAARGEGNRAALFRQLGRLQEALEGHRRALEIQRELGEPAEIARSLSNLGELYLALGEPERALVFLDESLELRRRAGDRRGEAYSRHNLGATRRDVGDLAGAREEFTAALESFQAVGDRRGAANTLRTLGEVLAALGDRAAAGARYAEALALQAELDDRRGRGQTLRRLAELDLAAGAVESARTNFVAARDLAREERQPLAELEALVGLVRTERRLDRRGEAEAHLAAAQRLVEQLAATVASPELRVSFQAARGELTELGVQLAWDAHRAEPGSGFDRLACERAHLARARHLAQGIADGFDRSALPVALTTRRRTASERLSLKALRLTQPAGRPLTPGERDVLEREVAAAWAELEAADAEIERALPGETVWRRPAVVTIAEIQAQLDPGDLLLLYALGQERSWLCMLGPESFAGHELPARAELEGAARALYESWRQLEIGQARGADRELATAMAKELLGPAAKPLAAASRLLVLPDGALGLLPFGALPLPGKRTPLVESLEITVLPSANVLAALRARSGAGRTGGSILVVADPVFGASDPRAPRMPAEVPADSGAAPEVGPGRLAWSGAEAAAVAAAWPTGTVRTVQGLAATLEVLTREPLVGHRIVHLATHGVMDTEGSERTGLLFSRFGSDGRPRPNFLTVPAIQGLQLAADLVVVSGCQTALGREVRFEGFLGLARGFLYAGAARVVASLWAVDDRATAELLARFHRHLAAGGHSPAAALAAAQRSLRREPRWSDPYFWAGFVSYGEPR
ncbi:MAG: CHAT domain-containing tetratricopeptide repeat protein [Thermoanaerobaculia bacterium]|nr:CHAT domain-containing tetratricopeptide repeat protein [Thermoanaerobaculia bacterium]